VTFCDAGLSVATQPVGDVVRFVSPPHAHTPVATLALARRPRIRQRM
jgi:hypothetical protein